MFGKRNATSEAPRPAPRIEPAAVRVTSAAPDTAETRDPPPRVVASQMAPQASKSVPLAEALSEDYYQIKTTIFSALIDTIDLAQLAQLDPDSAREEIRD